MNDDQVSALREVLTQFASMTDSAEATHHADSVRTFISGEPRPWNRATVAGHLTASAWALDRTGTHTALIHHRKLDRWLQPGGHIDDTDASWRAAAQRELAEETGLTRFIAQPGDEALFDVDVHPIPARKDEPAHPHYDLRYLFVAEVDATADRSLTLNADEAHDCRWFALTDLANDPTMEPSMRRMIELSVRRFP